MLTSYLILAAGLILLVICGDLLVRGAIGIAQHLHIPPIIIGLTVVAFGTSAPELVISLNAALSGSPDIAIGNVVGSNIANILIVMGLPALFTATECNQPYIVRNSIYVLAASLLFIVFCFWGPLHTVHGLILLGLLAAFLFESGRRASQDRSAARAKLDGEILKGATSIPQRLWVLFAFVMLGLAGLPVAAHFTVESAKQIAANWGVSEAAIGLTLVAFGTSLPELVTALVAVVRRQGGIALGNVLGSNLFNILGIVGVTATVVPLPVPQEFLRVDLWVMLAATIAVAPFALFRARFGRAPGAFFVLAYLVYVAVVVMPKSLAVAHLM